MITPADARSGKGHRDENFPVASRLIQPRHRAPILAFYEFVRTADESPTGHVDAAGKARADDRLGGVARPATTIRSGLAQLAPPLSPRHAQDLLTAFRMDAARAIAIG
jgi:hypothetical protein